MSSVNKTFSLDKDLLDSIEIERVKENRNASNMVETILLLLSVKLWKEVRKEKGKENITLSELYKYLKDKTLTSKTKE